MFFKRLTLDRNIKSTMDAKSVIMLVLNQLICSQGAALMPERISEAAGGIDPHLLSSFAARRIRHFEERSPFGTPNEKQT